MDYANVNYNYWQPNLLEIDVFLICIADSGLCDTYGEMDLIYPPRASKATPIQCSINPWQKVTGVFANTGKTIKRPPLQDLAVKTLQ